MDPATFAGSDLAPVSGGAGSGSWCQDSHRASWSVEVGGTTGKVDHRHPLWDRFTGLGAQKRDHTVYRDTPDES